VNSVGSNPPGHYVDTSLIKAPRLKSVIALKLVRRLGFIFVSSRYGQMEYRDPYRTKDKNGAPVLCFQCGASALPPQASHDAPPVQGGSRRPSMRDTESGQWRSIVSCDYCPLHWHLDCLSPPLLSMPPLDRKWMCPNHVDHTLVSAWHLFHDLSFTEPATKRIKHRIPRQNPIVVDVDRLGQGNNGNVEILDTGTSSTLDKVAVDEVFINGKRYRIPERVIRLDFWDKVYSLHYPTQRFVEARSLPWQLTKRYSRLKNSADVLLSPLTSLSSLDGDESETAKNPLYGMGVEDVRLALVGYSLSVKSSHNVDVMTSCFWTWHRAELQRMNQVHHPQLRSKAPKLPLRTPWTFMDVRMMLYCRHRLVQNWVPSGRSLPKEARNANSQRGRQSAISHL
jgi:hypothetical protein